MQVIHSIIASRGMPLACGGKGIAEAPGSVWRTRFYEYSMEKSGAEMALYPKIYAINNTCTHRGCRLSDGNLEQETVQCPCHGSLFNIKPGM